MKAIILAGGPSSRLLPLTKDTPKCLLPVRGKPIIDYQMSALIRNGVKEIIIVVGFKKEKIIEHLSKNYPMLSFVFINNEKYRTTGPAYGLWLARDHLNDSIIYLNSDVLYGANIIKRIKKNKNSSVTAIQQTPWKEEQVNIITDNGGVIQEIGKHISKESNCGEFVGVTKLDHYFCKKLVEALDSFTNQGTTNKFAADAINLAISQGAEMHALDITDLKTLEIDTETDLKEAEKMFGTITLLRQNRPFFSAKGAPAQIKRLVGIIRKKLNDFIA